MSALPARRGEQGGMLAEGTEDEIRGIIQKTGGEAVRGVRLPGGRIRVHITMPTDASPDASAARWWQGRSRRFWILVGIAGMIAFAAVLVAAVLIAQAILATVKALVTMALGALILIAAIAAIGSLGGGRSFSGTFKGRMD